MLPMPSSAVVPYDVRWHHCFRKFRRNRICSVNPQPVGHLPRIMYCLFVNDVGASC
jgi:hypothetical protein